MTEEQTKFYKGVRTENGCKIYIEGEFDGENAKELPMRLDLQNHSPAGFEWNYEGSGPAQTALALLADALGDDARALALHHAYKAQFVSQFPYNEWLANKAEIIRWASEQP